MELVVSSLDNDEDNAIASKDVSEHLVLSQRTAISIPYFRPTKDKAFKKLLRIHRHKCKEESIEVGPEFFSDAPKKRHSIRFSIAKAQQEVGGKIKKVVGSVRNSGESKRGKLSSIPILLEDLEEGKQSRFEDGTKLTAAYSNLSSLGLITSRASSTSSLSSFDSTTVPATPDSAPTTPAASLYSSPFNFPNPTPFSSPIAGPISPKTTLLPSFPTDFTPPSRTLTLDGIPTPRKESRVGFNTSKKLSIKTKDFQKMIRSRKKKSGVKLDVDDDAILANALVEIGIAVQEEEKVVMDVLIEHQRGLVLLSVRSHQY